MKASAPNINYKGPGLVEVISYARRGLYDAVMKMDGRYRVALYALGESRVVIAYVPMF
jgi:hypothetical protein